jgi:hypothetical protein
MVILDQNEFGLILRTNNKKIGPEDFERLYSCPPLLKGTTRFKKKRIDIKSNWMILLI